MTGSEFAIRCVFGEGEKATVVFDDGRELAFDEAGADLAKRIVASHARNGKQITLAEAQTMADRRLHEIKGRQDSIKVQMSRGDRAVDQDAVAGYRANDLCFMARCEGREMTFAEAQRQVDREMFAVQ